MVLIKNSKGQALVENVLILLVVIAAILTLQKVFFAPFRESTSEYLVGKYYDCALDIGELPGSAALDDCFQKSTGIDPNKFKNSSGAGAGSSKNGANGSSSSNNTSSKNGKNSNLAGRNKDSDKSSSSGSGGAGGVAGKRLAAKKFGENKESSESSEAGTDELGGNKGSGSKSRTTIIRSANQGGYTERRTMIARGISGEMKRKLEEELKKDKTLVLSKEESEGIANIKKTKRFAASEKKSRAEDTLKEEKFSFAGIVRIAMIVMILAAIIIFLIGQASQISKSMEK